jgi:tetratricopeptide (TPR) repeat protein
LAVRQQMAVALALLLLLLWGCGGGSASGDPDLLLADGWKAYATGDFDFAIQRFQSAAGAEGLTDQQRYSALLGLATTFHYQSNPDLARARDCYERLSKLDHPAAGRQSLLGLARVNMAEGRSMDARSQLAQIVEQYPDSHEADEAVLQLADALTRPGIDESTPGQFNPPSSALVERALGVLQARLDARPHNPLAPGMHMMMANIMIQQNDFGAAVEHLVAAEQEGIAVVRLRGIVLWRIARIAEKELKDYDLAERYYGLYVDEFQRTELYYRALKSLERVQELRKEGQAEGA